MVLPASRSTGLVRSTSSSLVPAEAMAMNRSQGNLDSGSVVVSAGAVDVAVGNLLGNGGADIDDFDAES